MKGIVFTLFNELIEDQFGIEMWDSLIDQTQPESGGIYTSVDTYPDEELFSYVQHLAQVTGTSVPELVKAFGKHMMTKFAEMHPEFFEDHDAKSFLKSVHDVIHVEVKKLHPDVLLPNFEYEDTSPDSLVMHYYSPRKLCHLAEGLIEGAAEHYETRIELDHKTCVHNGADHCTLALTFGAASVVNVA